MSLRGRVPDTPQDLDDPISQMPDPADIALDRAALSALLARTQPETRYILGRIAQGATYREIADDLRWSVGAVTPRPRRSPTTSRAGGRRHTTAREGRS